MFVSFLLEAFINKQTLKSNGSPPVELLLNSEVFYLKNLTNHLLPFYLDFFSILKTKLQAKLHKLDKINTYLCGNTALF